MSEFASTRRAFVKTATALTGLATLRPMMGYAEALPDSEETQQEEWDLRWIDAQMGKHKQVFDLSGTDIKEAPLRVVRNYLNAVRDVLKLEGADVNTIVGSTDAYPMIASDAMWSKYTLGERWEIKDPQVNGAWATRNTFLANPTMGPPALMARGTIFWQCNNALNAIASMIASSVGTPQSEVYAELRAGLIPEAKVVPAHTMVIGLVQERGFSYQKL